MCMKNHDERIESIFRKYNEKLEAKKRKTAVIRRTVFSAAGLCAALIVCVFALKIPSDFLNNKPGDLISATENVTSSTICTSKPAVYTTTAETSTPEFQTTTTVLQSLFQTQTTTAVQNTVSSVNTSATTPVTVRTDIPVTTSIVSDVTTTISSETSTVFQTTSNIVTTQTTTSETRITELQTTTTTTPIEIPVSPGEDSNKIVHGGNTYIISQGTVSSDNVGEVYAENFKVNNPVDGSPSLAKLVPINGFSVNYAVAAQLNDNPDYYVCMALNYRPTTLQSFFSDISLETNWNIFTPPYENIDNDNYSKDTVFSHLLSVPDTERIKYDYLVFNYSEYLYIGITLFSTMITSDIYGMPIIQISLTENGYITCSDGKYITIYYVGKDTVLSVKSSIMAEQI